MFNFIKIDFMKIYKNNTPNFITIGCINEKISKNVMLNFIKIYLINIKKGTR